MKEAKFTNKIFYVLLIIFIIILLGFNAFVLVKENSSYGVIPILIEVILLILIFKKNQYVKLGILTWAIIALIIGYGFDFIADIMDDFNNGFRTLKIGALICNLIGLTLGILIVDYTRRTVIIIDHNADKNS